MKDVGIETVTELKHKVNLLANEKTDKELSEDIQEELGRFEKTLNSVQSIADALEKRTKLVESKANKMQDSSNEFEGRLVDIETSVSTIMETQNRKVSFTAQLRPPGDATAVLYKKNQIIKFNHVFYNDGNGFNTTSGVFTVPVSGVYQFIFFVEGWKVDEDNDCPEAIVWLVVDRVGLVIVAVAEPVNKGHHVQAGNAYINYFTKGQQVLLGTTHTCETSVIAGYRTTFLAHFYTENKYRFQPFCGFQKVQMDNGCCLFKRRN
ncbi:uncharacterized protein LOC132732099 [Ruditapes philippinarum]|uniref:uncharacterized protein LOC132732099 n=1 Tax=Ruditapes philippinarum TaxID=129788 RepID=UPI00295AABD1|nr:uncharacterized protein LOC132732099 [Ruditapes philippinarum]